jgi:hypothetical protein
MVMKWAGLSLAELDELPEDVYDEMVLMMREEFEEIERLRNQSGI